jgi:hypothetical protein
LYPVAPWPRGPWLPLLLRPVGKLSMLSEIVKVVDGEGGGGDLKYCRPENFLVCRKNFPPIVETRQKIVNVVGKFQSCRRGGGENLKCCR